MCTPDRSDDYGILDFKGQTASKEKNVSEKSMTDKLNLTQGPITGQLARLTAPIIFGMLIFTLYMMTDLYFVGRLGPDAVAALSISGNVFFIHLGLSFIIGTGAMAAMIRQNFGVQKHHRIIETFWAGWKYNSLFMLTGAIACWTFPEFFIHFFSRDPEVIRHGVIYLKIVSLANVIVGTLLTAAVFQGIGKTYPTLVCAIGDNLLFAATVLTLPALMGWGIFAVWWIKLASGIIEMIFSSIWLTHTIKKMRYKSDLQGSTQHG